MRMKNLIKLLMILTITSLALYADKNKHIETYCFESPNFFMTNETSRIKVKRITLSIKDFNLSKSYKESNEVRVFYTLENNHTYEVEYLSCFSDNKKKSYDCNHEIDGAGHLKFNIRKKEISLIDLCTIGCYVDIITIGYDPDDSMPTYFEMSDKEHGYLSSMYSSRKSYDWDNELWVKGRKCKDINELDIRKVFYTKEEYKDKFSNDKERDPLFQELNTLSTNYETIIPLSQSYKTIASMMGTEGFGSNWINYDDIELFVYSNLTAFIRINPIVRTASKNTCLGGGYYVIELKKDMLKIKYLRTDMLGKGK